MKRWGRETVWIIHSLLPATFRIHSTKLLFTSIYRDPQFTGFDHSYRWAFVWLITNYQHHILCFVGCLYNVRIVIFRAWDIQWPFVTGSNRKSLRDKQTLLGCIWNERYFLYLCITEFYRVVAKVTAIRWLIKHTTSLLTRDAPKLKLLHNATLWTKDLHWNHQEERYLPLSIRWVTELSYRDWKS